MVTEMLNSFLTDHAILQPNQPFVTTLLLKIVHQFAYAVDTAQSTCNNTTYNNILVIALGF